MQSFLCLGSGNSGNSFGGLSGQWMPMGLDVVSEADPDRQAGLGLRVHLSDAPLPNSREYKTYLV